MMPEAEARRMQCLEHTYHFHPLFKGVRKHPGAFIVPLTANFTDGGKLISEEKLYLNNKRRTISKSLIVWVSIFSSVMIIKNIPITQGGFMK